MALIFHFLIFADITELNAQIPAKDPCGGGRRYIFNEVVKLSDILVSRDEFLCSHCLPKRKRKYSTLINVIE